MKKKRPKVKSTGIEVGKPTPEQEEAAALQLAEFFSPDSVLVTTSGKEFRGKYKSDKFIMDSLRSIKEFADVVTSIAIDQILNDYTNGNLSSEDLLIKLNEIEASI